MAVTGSEGGDGCGEGEEAVVGSGEERKRW